jgi:hypothetical protein
MTPELEAGKQINELCASGAWMAAFLVERAPANLLERNDDVGYA